MIYTFQPDDTTAVDTYLNSASPDDIQGGATTLLLGEMNTAAAVERVLMKWDLTSIPKGLKQMSGVLSLWVFADFASNTATLSVYPVLRNWDEATANWNHYTGTTDWGTAGCSNTTTDRGTTVLATASWTATQSAGDKIDFTFAAGALEPYFGYELNILIKTDGEANDAYQLDSSGSATASERPLLTINAISRTHNPKFF